MGLSTFLRRQPLKPSLDLDFLKQVYKMNLTQRAFADIFTFTRASGGGRINASGVYEWVAANQPRFDWKVADNAVLNLFAYSKDFSNSAWTKFSSSVSASQETAPDGSPATLMTSTGSFAALYQSATSLPVGTTITVAAEAKAGAGNTLLLVDEGQGGSFNANFNLSNGTFAVSGGTASMINLGNGFYRCFYTYAVQTGRTSATPKIWIGNYSGTSTAGQSIRLGRAGFFFGSVTPSKIPLTTGPGYDVGDLLLQGISIEDQRTNYWNQSVLPTPSNGTIGTTSIPSVYASVNYNSHTENTANGEHHMEFYQAGLTSGLPFVFSIDVKPGTVSKVTAWNMVSGFLGTVDLTDGSSTSQNVKAEKNIDGSYRISWTVVSAGAAVNFRLHADTGGTYVGSSRVYYWALPQIEQALSKGSRIQSFGSQVTRNSDSITETLGSWFAQGKGTIVWSGDVNQGQGPAVYPGLFNLNDGTTNNRLGAFIDSSGQIAFKSTVLGSPVQIAAATLVSFGQKFKAAFSWGPGGLYLSVNGGPVTNIASPIPTVNQLQHGKLDAFLNGHEAGFKYLPRTITGTALQALSA